MSTANSPERGHKNGNDQTVAQSRDNQISIAVVDREDSSVTEREWPNKLRNERFFVHTKETSAPSIKACILPKIDINV